MYKTIIVSALLLIIPFSICIGQNAIQFSIVGGAGYFLPLSEWTNHRYVEGVNQFQGGYTFTPGIEIKLGSIGIGFVYEWARMGTADWEDYARAQGDEINANSSIQLLGWYFRYYLFNIAGNLLHTEAGVAYLSMKGEENFNGFSYNYDFLSSGIAFMVGFGYVGVLSVYQRK